MIILSIHEDRYKKHFENERAIVNSIDKSGHLRTFYQYSRELLPLIQSENDLMDVAFGVLLGAARVYIQERQLQRRPIEMFWYVAYLNTAKPGSVVEQ